MTVQLPLNSFLLRPNVLPRTALSDTTGYACEFLYGRGGSWERLDWWSSQVLEAAVPGDIAVVLFVRRRAQPSWHEFVRTALDSPHFGAGAYSFGAAIFCAVQNPGGTTESALRWVAWCFGAASRMIARSASDPRFGLTIALNLLAPAAESQHASNVPNPRQPSLRELRYRTTAPYFQQTGHRASRDIPVDGFRVDRLSDLVAAVGGRTGISGFTNSVLGGRSLRFRADVAAVADLAKLSGTLLDLFRANGYRDTFGWIDNIRLVEEDAVVEKLRGRLIADLSASPVPPTVDAILPDDLLPLDDDRAIRYIVFPRERVHSACRVNLTVDTIAGFVTSASRRVSPDGVLDSQLRFLDDAMEPIGRARLVECVCADFLLDDQQYMAYDGDFYLVDRSFVERIDQELSQLPASPIGFPPYGGQSEPEYIDQIRREHQGSFVVLDRELIRVEGETGVEACDVVSRSGALVHLKRKGKSSVLSHLFLQAANSCELLRRSSEARAKFTDLVRERSSDQSLTTAISDIHAAGLQEGVEIVFAFLGDWRGRGIANLPLFSRISLVQESRKVAALGFRPSFALISSN